MGYRIEGAGCRWSATRVSDAASVRGIIRKHDCALLTLYPKHSNAQGAIIEASLQLPALTQSKSWSCIGSGAVGFASGIASGIPTA